MTLILNPEDYRITPDAASVMGEYNYVTRETVERLLDAGVIEVSVRHGKWWRIKRNGATKRWVNNASRIRIPWKAGLHFFGAITDADFVQKEPTHGQA